MPVADGLWAGAPSLRIGGAAHDASALRDAAGPIARRVAALPGAAPVVALAADNRVETVAALCGIWRGGGVAALLDPAWPPALAARARSLLGPGTHAMASLPAAQADLPAGDDDAPFLIGFTSGSTGAPKAWRRRHRSWTGFFPAAREAFAIDGGSRVLAPGALATTLTLFPLMLAIDAGAAAILLPRFDAAACRAAAEATHLFAVPTMLHRLAEGPPLPGIRHVVSAGAKLDPALRARLAGVFPDARLIEYYGASELGFVSLARDDAPPDSVGRPFPGVDVAVFGGDGIPVPAGVTGEIRIRSAGVVDAVLADGGDGGYRAGDDGWATVGDIGRLDADGYLHIQGRAGEMILSGGVNVFPGEVEGALARIDGVAGAAAFGMPDAEWGAAVCAALVWTGATAPDRAALRDACATMLPRSKCPRRLFRVAALPLTGSGKIDRAALREGAGAWQEIL